MPPDGLQHLDGVLQLKQVTSHFSKRAKTMKVRSLFRKFSLLILCLTSFSIALDAQKSSSATPREERLLNGLKVLMWSDPSAPNVRVSIRIHSGSAFDPQGKEGLMKLLAENIFPTPASREFFTEDLEGTVEVVSNFDYIQVDATAKSSEFITLLETLAQAVSNPTIDKDTTAALKKALSEKIIALEKDPAYVADRAAERRLFGTFPYGRSQMGSLESLQRIDFADLLFVKERFLSADNATVAISGNFSGDLGFRAARRYFGAWLKSDKRIPSTFRQPDAPDTQPMEVTFDAAGGRSSFAFRGLARNDPDYGASLIFEQVLRSRLQKTVPTASLAYDARTLPGVIMLGMPGAGSFPATWLSERISESEFTRAKGEATTGFARRALADQWLDVDTYRTNVATDSRVLQNATLVDVQRVADRLAKNPIASVILKPATPAQ